MAITLGQRNALEALNAAYCELTAEDGTDEGGFEAIRPLVVTVLEEFGLVEDIGYVPPRESMERWLNQ